VYASALSWLGLVRSPISSDFWSQGLPLLKLTISLSTKVALGVIIVHNICQSSAHDCDGEGCGSAPVDEKAACNVVGVYLEVDVAASLGPITSHAIVDLVSAKCLGEDGVG